MGLYTYTGNYILERRKTNNKNYLHIITSLQTPQLQFRQLFLQIETGQLQVLHHVARLKVTGVRRIVRFRHERRLNVGHGRPVERLEKRHLLHLLGHRPRVRIHR